jgi:glycolate oxidase iron-sulfur subunit
MTTCPSGVHYMHLVDHAREYIEQTYSGPVRARAALDAGAHPALSDAVPHRASGAKIGRPFAFLMPMRGSRRCSAMAPKQIPPVSRNDDPQVFPAQGERARCAWR